MPSDGAMSLSPLNTHWQNRSHSSVNSDAATFYSTNANMELNQLSTQYPQWATPQETTFSPRIISQTNQESVLAPKVESFKMDRQDSGFSDGADPESPLGRTSSSSARPPRAKNTSTNSRPSTKRAARSVNTGTQQRHSTSAQRPHARTRHTTTDTHSTPHQFFYFPTLQDPAANVESIPAPAPSPPPATVHYWTSDSTRRLEYAAIDAANRGVRGFITKLVPDCILSPSSRRTKFHGDDADSDAGSVRRYRLVLPEEKAVGEAEDQRAGAGKQRPGLFRRWTSLGFGKKG